MPKFIPKDLIALHQYFSERVGQYFRAEDIEEYLGWNTEDPNHRRLKGVCEWLTDLGAPLKIAEGILADRHPNTKAYGYSSAGLSPMAGLIFTVEHYAALALMFRWMEKVIGPHSDLDFEGALQALSTYSGADTHTLKEYERLSKRIQVLPQKHRPIEPQIFEKISRALGKRLKLIFNYRSRTRMESRTWTTHPQGLLNYRGNWYLQASIEPKGNILKFALDQMSELDFGDAAYLQPLKNLSGAGYGLMFEGSDIQIAKIRVQKSTLPWIEKEIWHPEQSWEILENGEGILSFPFSQTDELIQDLLSYGAGVEVLEPKDLREKVIEEYRRALGVYGLDSTQK